MKIERYLEVYSLFPHVSAFFVILNIKEDLRKWKQWKTLAENHSTLGL